MSVTHFLKKPVFSLPARQELPNLQRFFRRLWLIFGGGALLLVLSSVVFENIGASLEQERADSVSAVNLLGRQRTDSQVLSRLMMQAEKSTPSLQTYYLGRMDLVWGIMSTFTAIGAASDTSLATVAPGIAEALFATALGLVAAIPAVVGFNKISSDLSRYALRLENFAGEFGAILSRQLDTTSKRVE